MRLAEAAQLVEALSDSLLRPALEEFVQTQRMASLNDLMRSVRMREREPMKESFIAGKVEAYETLLTLMDAFAKEQLEANK